MAAHSGQTATGSSEKPLQPTMTASVDEQLDALLAQYFTLLQTLRDLRSSTLHTHLRDAHWSLTQLRFTASTGFGSALGSGPGMDSLGKASYENREDMQPLLCVGASTATGGVTALQLVNAQQQHTTQPAEQPVHGKPTSTLRARGKQPVSDMDDDAKHAEDEEKQPLQQYTSTTQSTASDPITWFSSMRLSHAGLSSARQKFTRALQAAVQVANVTLQMREIEQQCEQLKGQLAAAKANATATT